MKFTPSIPPCSNENFCFHVGDYSFGFNGKDKESEFNSGAYDFGARIHDARLGRWMSVDPKVKYYPESASYDYCTNNPMNEIDPDGESAIAVKGIFRRRIVIKMDLNFYGSEASSALAKKTAANIEDKWNAACGKVMVDGVEYKVKFKIRGKTISERQAEKEIANNNDQRENYIRLGSSGVKVSSTDAAPDRSSAGNTGSWLISELGDENGNTDVHEAGHLMGWCDGMMGGSRVTHDYNGKMLSDEPCIVQPGIMTPRSYSGENKYNEFNPFDEQFLDENGSVDPSKRSDPTTEDVSKLGFNWDDLSKSRKIGTGISTRWFWHNKGRDDKSKEQSSN